MNKLFDLLRETYRGKTIGRILFNWKIKERARNLRGITVDLGSGKDASYWRYAADKPDKIIGVDINPSAKPDIVADINKSLPFPDYFADSVFLINVIYIVENPETLLKEANRILKAGGRLFIGSPFVFNEAREPADYRRLTSLALDKLLRDAGFTDITIEPLGERFTAAVYLISPFLLIWPVKFIFYILALGLDKLIPQKMKSRNPAPIGYFIKAKK